MNPLPTDILRELFSTSSDAAVVRAAAVLLSEPGGPGLTAGKFNLQCQEQALVRCTEAWNAQTDPLAAGFGSGFQPPLGKPPRIKTK